MCSVLDVTSNEILEGTDGIGSRSNPSEYELVTKDSENGRVLTQFLGLERNTGPISRVYPDIVGDTERRDEGIIIMSIEGTGWSPVIW